MDAPLSREDAELLRDLLVSKTGSWSANSVVKMIQAMDLGIRRQDILAYVRGWIGSGSRRPGPKAQTLLFGTHDPPGTELGTELGTEFLQPKKGGKMTAEIGSGHLNSPPHPLEFNIASELRSSGLLGHFVPSQSKNAGAKDEKSSVPNAVKLAAWIAPLGTEFRAIAKVQFRELKTAERYVIGRTHALLFGNYRVDEKSNRAAGVRLAAQIARMGTTKRFGDLTCREYVRYGVKLLQLRHGKPFHSPFDIEAVVEYE